MRVLVLGGTRFIGRAVVERLAQQGDEVTVLHRGSSEPSDLPDVRHLHIPRAEWPAQGHALRAIRPDVVIDCRAMSRNDARTACAALPEAHLVVLSSQDVYRAFASLQRGDETDAVPIGETAPLRQDRYPYRGENAELHDYSKIDVEEEYAVRGAAILRLPAVYGEHDSQRREEFILRRVRAGRAKIPIGHGRLLWTRGYVRDIARGICQAASDSSTSGEVFNLGEGASWSVRQWAAKIIEVSGTDAKLVNVPDQLVPHDMQLTSTAVSQHVLVSSQKARAWFAYEDTDPMVALRASVAWHLAHPPADSEGDFSSDDRALAAASS